MRRPQADSCLLPAVLTLGVAFDLNSISFHTHSGFCSANGCCASDGDGGFWLPRPAGPPYGLGHGGVPPAAAGPQGPSEGQEPLPPNTRGSLQNAACHLCRDRGGRGGGLLTPGGGEGTSVLPAVPGEPAAEHADPPLPAGSRPSQLHPHADAGQPGLQ